MAISGEGSFRFVLAHNLDFSACSDLFSEFQGHVGSGVVVDASGVGHLGAPCVQVLLCAARSWLAQGAPFAVVNRSSAFVLGLERLGIGADELPVSEGL